MILTINKARLFGLPGIALLSLCSYAQDITITNINLRVKQNSIWITTSGQLFKVQNNTRQHVASVDANGKPDVAVKCLAGERFEADPASMFDTLVPPVRTACKQILEFQYSRTVYAAWAQENGKATLALTAEPRVYSELSTLSRAVGNQTASSAFSNAAIASSAKLLGDEKLDRYVLRDAGQNYKLVFTESGKEALKVRQQAAGLTSSGQLDSATQALFTKELAALPTNGGIATTPAVNCGSQAGVLLCSLSGTEPFLGGTPVLAVPSFSVDVR